MYCNWPRLGRCCFCMPLRRGVLIFAYMNMVYSALLLGLFCYHLHYAMAGQLSLGRSIHLLPTEVGITFFCLELVFNAVLIYGAHKKLLMYVKVYFFYTLVTCVALLMLQIASILWSRHIMSIIEKCIFSLGGLCIQIYLLTLVRSLIKNLEVSGPHTCENQLHPLANGELNVESNGIYSNTSVIPIDAED